MKFLKTFSGNFSEQDTFSGNCSEEDRCNSCGAPLNPKKDRCEYCGSYYKMKPRINTVKKDQKKY